MVNINKISKWILFICISAFLVADSTIINRSALVVMTAICGLKWILYSKGKIKHNLQMLCFFLYGLMLLFATLYTIAPSSRAYSICFSYFVSLLLAFFLADNITDKRDVDFFLRAVLFASFVQLIYMISIYGVNIFRVINQSETSIRLGDQTSNSNSVGMLFSYGSLIAAFFFLQHIHNRLRVVYIVLSVLLGSVSLLSASRKGLIVLFVGLFIVILFCGDNNSFNRRLKAIALSVASVTLLYVVTKNVSAFSKVYIRMDKLIKGLNGSSVLDYSSRERFSMIETGIKVFKANPIFGEGTYASYHYFGSYSHNNFVELLMNTGLVGFAIYYLPFPFMIYRIIRISKEDKRSWLLLFLYLWILIGGYGMVNYYEKITMIFAVLTIQWINLTNEYTTSIRHEVSIE